ncbi:protein kinase [bacterium]|nr:protein kinase [bacterium]
MCSESSDLDPFEVVAESFLARYRAGERPSIDELAARHPELAGPIRELLPALIRLERDLALDDETQAWAVPQLPEIDKRLGDYRLLREIGRGGMGVVYEAEQVSLGRRVALKVLPDHVAGDRMALARFRREAKAAARLHHTNIVPVYEVSRDGEFAYYAMQFIEGQGLDKVIDELARLRDPGRTTDLVERHEPSEAVEEGFLHPEIGLVARSLVNGQFATQWEIPSSGILSSAEPSTIETERITRDTTSTSIDVLSDREPAGFETPTTPGPTALLPGGSQVSTSRLSGRLAPFYRSVAEIGRQAAQGLAYAHANGIVHRDIKPSNLLLDQAGVVWIADFGLAKGEDDGLTQTGDVLGTFRYMPPCRFQGECDLRADIYALGMTLYELLTLRPAFDESDRLKLIEQIKNQEPPRPRTLDSRIPRDLETIVLKAIEKDRERRYHSADSMAEDLRRFLADEPIRARQMSVPERFWRTVRRNPEIALLSGVLAGMLVLGSVAALVAASRFSESATTERKARLQADKALNAAQAAEKETKLIAEQADADKQTAERENYRSTIKLAESMLQGDAQARYRAADILWGAQPELRGWEWGHLMARCPLERWSLQTNQGGLDTFAASSDGRFLATAGKDGTVALWDSWTLKELWRQKTGRANKIEFDPRNRLVCVGSSDRSQPSFKILEIEKGRIEHEAARAGITDFAFGPGGDDFYILHFVEPRPGQKTQSVGTLERLRTGTWLRSASVVLPPVRHSGDLKLVVDSAGVYVGVHDVFIGFEGRSAADPEVLLYEAQELSHTHALDPILPRYGTSIRPATPVLHSGFGEMVHADALSVSGNSTGGPFFQFQHSGYVDYLTFDPQSHVVLAGSNDGTVTIRDGDGGSQILSHGSRICGFERFPDGRLVTGGTDGLLKCWTPGLAAELAIRTRAEPASAQAEIVAFADDGATLLFPQRSNFQVFRTKDLTYRSFPLKAVGEYAGRALLIEPKTNELVVATETGLDFYDVFRNETTLAKKRTIEFARSYHAAFDASGRVLVVSGLDQEVAVFDVASKRRLTVPEVHGLGVVAVNPGGTRAALLTSTSLQVWDVSTGRLLNRLDGPFGAAQTANWNQNQSIPVFHRDGDLLAFVAEPENSPSRLILWDTALGTMRSSTQAGPGDAFRHAVFSPDGNRIFMCGDKLRVWDWRIGKELFSPSNAINVAASPDGVTIATAGWNPSLGIAKALPWKNLTRDDGELHRAVDDLWIYTAGLPRSIKMAMEPAGGLDPVLADEAEILGDIQCRRGQAETAIAHYDRAIEIRQGIVLADPGKAQPQYRLATVQEKRISVAAAVDPASRDAVLGKAVEFWQKLVSDGGPHQPLAWRICLAFQLRLVDFQLARNGKDPGELLLPQIRFWCERSGHGPHDRLVRYGLHEFWARMAAAAPGFVGDRKAIDDLVERHPKLSFVIGERFAAEGNWERAIAIFDKPNSVVSGYDQVRKLLALAAAGQGKNETPVNDATKSKLRRKALDWLQAELAASSRQLEAGPAQDLPAIAVSLQFWKKDSDLAVIRETDSLARLPADEQKLWHKFWAQVDSLLNRLPTPDKVLDPDNPETLEGIHMRAHQLAISKPGEAEPLFRQALKGYRKFQGPDGFLTLELTRDLANLLNQFGRGAEAEPSLRDALEELRKQTEPDNFRMAALLAPLGLSLIQQDKWTEAEPVLRECLVVRENLQPDEWTTYATRSLLGAALMGQKKYAESEPLIVSGYEGMKAREAQIPPPGRLQLTEASVQVVKLYEAWGKMEKVAEWRARLARPADQPKPQP